MAESKAIAIQDFSYAYEGSRIIPVLKNIDLEVEHGEFVGIVGRMGAGKTTLCLAMNGIIPHYMGGYLQGTILVDGMDTRVYTPSDLALRTVGMVFQDPEAQFVRTTVLEEVAFGLENLGVPREEIIPRVEKALQQVGLWHLPKIMERSPFELSGGQKQRLSIACALVLKPKILILDEPDSNVDPVGVNEVFSLLAELKKNGLTTVVASHRVERLAMYADTIVVLNEGKIVMRGTPAEVFSEVERLMSIGERVPEVTEAAHLVEKDYRIARTGSKLPVKVDEGLVYFRSFLEYRKK